MRRRSGSRIHRGWAIAALATAAGLVYEIVEFIAASRMPDDGTTDGRAMYMLSAIVTFPIAAGFVGVFTWLAVRRPEAPHAPLPPGWYPDPRERAVHRYWDGATWTGHVR